jgi:hypothetical protein
MHAVLTPFELHRSRVVRLAWGAIAAQAMFVGGWLVLGSIEGHGYSSGRHDISDLGALTAHHVWLNLPTIGIAGALTIAFATFALRPALMQADLKQPASAWLVALSLPALDNLSDAFFRLDCRAADRGCAASNAAASWHGKIHVIVGAIAAIATLIAPFALAYRMRRLAALRDKARLTLVFGLLLVASIVAYGALSDTDVQGWSQRAAAVLVASGVVVLALWVRRLAITDPLSHDATHPSS